MGILFVDKNVALNSLEDLLAKIQSTKGFEHMVVTTTPFDEFNVKEILRKRKIYPCLLHKPTSYSSIFDCVMDVLGGEHAAEASSLIKNKTYRDLLREKPPLKVLVVDDTASNRSLAMELLAMANIQPEVVSGGAEAIKEAEKANGECPYDLVLMDINMPKMDGYSATKKLKKVAGWESVPVAAMTAEVFGDVEALTLEAGMVGMVSKPIDPEEMFKVIHNLVYGEDDFAKPYSISKEEEVHVDFPPIDGLDVQAGIRRMGGRLDLYKRLLKGFCHDYKHFDSYFDELQHLNDQETMGRVLHSLKGMAGTMEAKSLYELTIETESAFVADDANFDQLITKLRFEVSALVKLLNNLPFL